MSSVKEAPYIEAGTVIGFGGTNARIATSHESDITEFETVSTPQEPEEFFGWMARGVLDAAEKGHKWMVAGFPGPVSEDGRIVGPMANVPGLSASEYDLVVQLNAADPSVGRALKRDISLIAVNDGELAAQAAVSRVGEYNYKRTAALIDGTGTGAGVVDLDPGYKRVARANRSNPFEIGHVQLSEDATDTYENNISGPALTRDFRRDPKELMASHPAWEKVGTRMAMMATTLGIMNGVELVVPCGGIGAGAISKYKDHLDRTMLNYRRLGNSTQVKFAPEVLTIDPAESDIFEMYGGEAIMRDYLTGRGRKRNFVRRILDRWTQDR